MSLTAPELEYLVDNWAAGFMDSPEPATLPKGATPSAANCDLTSVGPGGRCTLSKRKTARLVTPSCLVADTRVDALYEFTREGVATGQLLAMCDGHLMTWDGATAFVDVADLGMASGGPIEIATLRNLAQIMDGTVQQLFDGTTVFDVGFDRPTAPPALAAVAPAASGETGDYQSVATWYDSVHDHESSPTEIAAAVTFAAQDRQHTKPAGAPPAQVDKWRVYVRKDAETYFKLVAETAIGTSTATEAISDTQRRLASTLAAPLPNANDKPPVFAFVGSGLGYRFGVQTADSFVWVSALGDPQSQHPKDKIGVGRGDGQALTTVKTIGTTIVAQKAERSWYLEGDRMPFVPKELRGSWGNHSQSSSVEANASYWAWDVRRGPYVTDLESRWESLVDGRIATIVASVNTTAQIRCCHFEDRRSVAWLVATGASTRLRTMLVYNYLIGAWLPPIYGIEYASFTTFQLSDGTVRVFVGDEWGRVFQYFLDDIEGVPSGTTSAAVTGSTPSTVTAAGAAFYTTGDGLKGLPVAVVDEFGAWQFRIAESNTADTITIDTVNGSEWDIAPNRTYTVVVGAIDWYWATPLITFDKPFRRKKGGYLLAEVRASGSDTSALTVRARFGDVNAADTLERQLSLAASSAWGTGLWGVMLWGRPGKQTPRKRIGRSFHGIQIEVSNRYPQEPMELVTFGLTADGHRGRWAHA